MLTKIKNLSKQTKLYD